MSVSDQFLMSFFVMGIAIFSSTISRNNASKLKPFLDNQIIKTIILFLIAFYASHNVQLAIILAVSFITLINILNENEIEETFQQTKQIKDIEHFTNTIIKL